jgi:hypothetical protein
MHRIDSTCDPHGVLHLRHRRGDSYLVVGVVVEAPILVEIGPCSRGIYDSLERIVGTGPGAAGMYLS